MKYCRILLYMTVLICLAFQAYAQSDPLGESPSGSTMGSSGDYLSPDISRDTNPDEGVREMVQWLDQPVTEDVAEPTITAASTTHSSDSAKSTTTATSKTYATEPASTTTATATSKTPGFQAIFAAAGILVVTFIALRRRI